MVRFSASEILPVAGANGFNAEVVEKVFCLMNLLNALNRHPSLKGRWVLKGGTALNLFVLRHPRLSVDIDLNYIAARWSARKCRRRGRESSMRPRRSSPVRGSRSGGRRANTQ